MRRSAVTATLHGRSAELATIRGWLSGSIAGGPRVCVVEGEAGIGKTRLLEAAARDAAELEFAVFAGRADELERSRPFGPLIEALCRDSDVTDDAARSDVIGLLEAPDPEANQDPGSQFRVVDGFVQIIESVAIDRPVALILDDLQWADPSTLLTINSLTRRLDYLNLAVLASLRSVPQSAELAQLLDSLKRHGALHVMLAPLDAEAVAGIVTELIAAEPGATLAAVVEGAAGNPLFVTELVGALGQEGGIEIVDGRAEVRDVPVPPSIRLTILRRLAFVGEDVIELLRHASLLGSTFELRELAVVVDRRVPDLARAFDEPIRAGIIEQAGGRLRFRHDLIREAIYDDLLEGIRAALHCEAARRLAEAGAPPLQVANQLLLGARVGDSDAVALLHDAARSVAGFAPSIAVELLERSVELVGPHGGVAHSLLDDLVRSQLWSGRPRDAEMTARRAIRASPPPEVAGPLHVGLVQALGAQGRHHDLIDEAEHAQACGRLDQDAISQLKAEAANALLLVGRLEDAEAAAREAVDIGRPVGSEGADTGLLVLSDAARGRGLYIDALRYAEEAARSPDDRKGGRRGWGPEIFMAMALRSLDRFDEADDAIQRGRRLDEQVGRVAYLPVYGYEFASGLFLAGRWTEAVSEAEAGLALADEVGLLMLRSWPLGLLALIALHRGDLAEARAKIDEAGEGQSPLLALARCQYQEASGDLAGALTHLEQSWERSSRAGMAHAARLLGPSLVRLALTLDERQSAAQVAVSLERAAARTSVPSLRGAALLCRGLVDSDVDTLLRGVEAYRSSPRILERALASEAAASALAATGALDQAKPMFGRAVDELSEIGADHDAARVMRTMRELGLGRRRRGRRTRHAYGWESITAAELEVVRLAADGLTNPEIGRRLFISPRTVQSHLSHAFRKLDISSRVELAAEVGRRGGPHAPHGSWRTTKGPAPPD